MLIDLLGRGIDSSRRLLVLLVAGLALALAGCNTISGAGQDVEAAGEAIEGTAEDTQDSM